MTTNNQYLHSKIILSGVYKITCVPSNKIYIGSAKDMHNRWAVHRYQLDKQKHNNMHLLRAYNKYGKDNFIWEIIEECSVDQLRIREQHYLDTLQPFGKNGFNMSKTARAPNIGISPSLETRTKLSAGRRGKVHSAETKLKMSQSRKGRKRTKEQIEKHRASILGRKQSEETIRKKTKDYIAVSPTGEILNINNITKFCRDYSFNIGGLYHVMNGTNKHYKGWTFKRAF
jgi:group I intron endonuclease